MGFRMIRLPGVKGFGRINTSVKLITFRVDGCGIRVGHGLSVNQAISAHLTSISLYSS